MTLHVHTCSGRNRIIPLMRRPNTDSAPNKPVTLPRNQLFYTLRGHESRPHCRDMVLRYAVTLQVCTHPYATYFSYPPSPVLSQFPPDEAFQTESTAQVFDFVPLLYTAISSLPNLLPLLQPICAELRVLCENLKSINP